MENYVSEINPIKLIVYILKRIWLVLICAAIGFGGLYWYTAYKLPNTYTASGTMYVYNGNPNLVNYQYTNSSDLNSAVQLLDTYMVVVKSDKVLDAVAERLSADYPGIKPAYISSTLSMGSVSETGVLRVRCVTDDPQKSADICNAVLDVAPSEIIRVVNAGGIEIIDYAKTPLAPNDRAPMRKGLMGAAAGAAAAAAVLFLFFMMDQKVTDEKELAKIYKPPVLSAIRRSKEEHENPNKYLLNEQSPMDVVENYAKLRMNLLYTLTGKNSKVVVVTSSIAGEGKSTITANLAISCAMSGKRVLLIDADMRRASQRDIFGYHGGLPGLSDVLVGEYSWEKVLHQTKWENLQILLAGHIPPNPAELLGTEQMNQLLDEFSSHYDLILMDAPPINIVSDPLSLSAHSAGCLFMVRQNYSDHREIRKALTSADMTGMDVLGFVFYGEKLHQGSYYNRKYYKNYYHQYDTRTQQGKEPLKKSGV